MRALDEEGSPLPLRGRVHTPTRGPWIRLAIAALTLLAAGSGVRYLVLAQGGDELQAMRRENQRLKEINRSFEANLQQLQSRLAEQEQRTNELAIVAGIAEASRRIEGGDSGRGGVGGSFDPFDQTSDFSTLEARVETLGDRLEGLSHGLTERQLRVSARPSLSPVKGIVTSGYGSRTDPLTGLEMFHRGIDISAPPGNLVYATADGIVTRAGRIGNFGKAVYLAHGFGYATRYAHLASINVEPGQQIQRGDVIGQVGKSGRATGYHVHYEVHEAGRSRDPLQHMLD
jgi:murein DD-endopeptidase MepM/ murein hydrolase activator NlpD